MPTIAAGRLSLLSRADRRREILSLIAAGTSIAEAARLLGRRYEVVRSVVRRSGHPMAAHGDAGKAPGNLPAVSTNRPVLSGRKTGRLKTPTGGKHEPTPRPTLGFVPVVSDNPTKPFPARYHFSRWHVAFTGRPAREPAGKEHPRPGVAHRVYQFDHEGRSLTVTDRRGKTRSSLTIDYGSEWVDDPEGVRLAHARAGALVSRALQAIQREYGYRLAPLSQVRDVSVPEYGFQAPPGMPGFGEPGKSPWWFDQSIPGGELETNVERLAVSLARLPETELAAGKVPALEAATLAISESVTRMAEALAGAFGGGSQPVGQATGISNRHVGESSRPGPEFV